MKRVFLFLIIALVAVSASAKSCKKVAKQPQLSTIEIIEKVNDYWQQTHSPKVRSFWDEAAYHTGNMEAYKLLGHARWQSYSEQWARYNLWQGAREKDPAKWKYKTYGEAMDFVLFGDWQICFQTYLDLYELNPDDYKIARAIEVMDYEVRQPQNDFWWWADALYMVMPVFSKLYKTTGDVKYLDKLSDNYRWADELMYDKEEHLYFRDAKYIYPKAKTRNGGKDFWARGNGWVLAGLAKVLSDMPQDYKNRPFFEQRFRELAEAVAKCQQPEGYWTRSMLDKDHAEGPETSGTAFFTYGLLWGMNHHILSKEQYLPTVQRAWDYLTQKALQPSGAVGFVQPIGERAIPGQQLSEKNEANFGVGAFLLAACEKLRFDEARASSSSFVVEIQNLTDDYRNEVVGVEAKHIYEKLGISGGRQFMVLDAVGLEVPYQLTHDGQLLIEASVRPQATARFTIRRGVPKNYQAVCYGRQYPERKEDFAWENDRGAYRVYGPALQRTGERSFGIDVWTKNTPELVVEQRYWTEDVIWMPTVEKLRRENRQRGDSLYNTISYHHDHGRGLDPYKVGATLGCGAPALMNEGRLVMPYCYTNYTLLDNGPLRFTVRLDYGKTAFNGDSITEHRIISLDKGSNFCQMTVCYDGMTKPTDWASGVVVHDERAEASVCGMNSVAHADPTDNPNAINAQLFVATLFPNGPIELKKQEGHLLGIKHDYIGKPYTYYFGTGWSKYDVRSMEEWMARIGWFLRTLETPLIVTLK